MGSPFSSFSASPLPVVLQGATTGSESRSTSPKSGQSMSEFNVSPSRDASSSLRSSPSATLFLSFSSLHLSVEFDPGCEGLIYTPDGLPVHGSSRFVLDLPRVG